MSRPMLQWFMYSVSSFTIEKKAYDLEDKTRNVRKVERRRERQKQEDVSDGSDWKKWGMEEIGAGRNGDWKK